MLLAEDEENIREATRRILEGLGCQVVPARDGLEALERLADCEPFAVVLLDLMMPRLDGRQALDALHRTHPGLPVVLCSGYSEQEITEGWAGVFLPKPYSKASLKAALQKALALEA